MPTITLTRSASSSGTGGWYAIGDDDRVNFQYDANSTLGGAGIEITQIKINGRARNSSSATKQLQLGFKPALGSARNTWSTFNGQNVVDGAFTAVPSSNGNWTYQTFTRVYSPSLNSGVFAIFAGHIREQFSSGQAIYLGIIQPRSQYETQIDLVGGYWTIEISYELLGNVPSADVSTATLGSTAITTTLIKAVSGSTTTLRYVVNGTTVRTVSLGTGVTDTYTPPTTVGAQFPSTRTAILRIVAQTFVGSTSYGTVSTSVILTLPSDAAPTCTCTPTRTWVSGVASSAQIDAYVQTKSGVTFALAGTGKYGATIDYYRLTINNRTYSRNGDGSIAHTSITSSGSTSYTYTVVDSRGLSRSYTGTLTVLAWSAPKITRFAIDRVTAGNILAVDGTYARVTVQASAGSLAVDGAQKNAISYYVQYRQAGATSWTTCDTVSTGAISVSQSTLLKDGGQNVGSFDDMTGYEFRLALSDIYGTVYAYDEMPTKETYWGINETNGSMGFGGEATGTGSTPQYDFYGRINARNGIVGGTRYSTSEIDTGNNWVDGKRIYARTLVLSKSGTSDLTHSFSFSGMDTVWADAGASFYAFNDNVTVHLGCDGSKTFKVLLNRANNQVAVGANGAGTAYVRILYTKN